MKKDLYKNTIEKIKSFSNVAGSLYLNQIMTEFTNDWNLHKMDTSEAVTIACAYYVAMKNDQRCAAIMEQNVWKQFFMDNFKNISADMLKDSSDFILADEEMSDIVINNCSPDELKKFLETQEKSKDSAEYSALYEKFAKKCEDKGIKLEEKKEENTNESEVSEVESTIEQEAEIKKEAKVITTEALSEQELNYEKQRLANDLKMIKMQQAALEKQIAAKEHKLLSDAASSIGVSENGLADKLGNSIKGVDTIVVEPELIEKMCSVDAKAATVPKNLFQNLKSRIQEKRILKNTEIDVVKEDGITSLHLAGKETNFDKIATASKQTVNKLKQNIKNKRDALDGVVLNGIDKADNLITIVRNSIKNANAKILGALSNAYGAVENAAIRTAVNVSQFGENMAGLYKDTKHNVKAGIAQGLYNMGDKINPDDLTLRSATKVGELKPEDLINSPEVLAGMTK